MKERSRSVKLWVLEGYGLSSQGDKAIRVGWVCREDIRSEPAVPNGNNFVDAFTAVTFSSALRPVPAQHVICHVKWCCQMKNYWSQWDRFHWMHLSHNAGMSKLRIFHFESQVGIHWFLTWVKHWRAKQNQHLVSTRQYKQICIQLKAPT